VVILILWPGSRVWYVNPDCHQYFFNISLYQFFFSDFILQHWVYWRWSFFIFLRFAFYDDNPISWPVSWIFHADLDWLEAFTSFYFYFKFGSYSFNFFCFWSFFFLISSFNIGLLRIELHIVFQCDDPSLMTRVTYMKY
jgi:hypothetical protein